MPCGGCNGCGKCEVARQKIRATCLVCGSKKDPVAVICPVCGALAPAPPGMSSWPKEQVETWKQS